MKEKIIRTDKPIKETRCLNDTCNKIIKTTSMARKYCNPGCQQDQYKKRKCRRCGNKIPLGVEVNGVYKNLQRRTHCLDCKPINGDINYNDIELKAIEEKKLKKKEYHKEYSKQKYYEEDWNKLVKQFCAREKTKVTNLVDGCQLCGYNKCLKSLIFHHVIESEKSFTIPAREFRSGILFIIDELKKCIVVCANCHGEIHDNMVDVKIVQTAHIIFNSKLLNFINT